MYDVITNIDREIERIRDEEHCGDVKPTKRIIIKDSDAMIEHTKKEDHDGEYENVIGILCVYGNFPCTNCMECCNI